MNLKIVTIIGARPQFIKAAVVSRALRNKRGLREVLVHTGQHYDRNMSGQFFDELDIPRPDYNLGVGSGSYGDTNSTLAGALAAAKLHIPVAHVEGGLRSFNRQMPEEINRVMTDRISTLLFAPTKTAVANLTGEGIAVKKIELVGDVMCDAAIFYAGRAARFSRILKNLKLEPKNYVLATIHRAENTDEISRLKIILRGLELVAINIPVVLPLHPRTRSVMKSAGLAAPAGVRLIEPVGYLDMIELERNATVIATDSGGVQKESYFHRVPCVTLREETEWTELIHTKWNRLCPPKSGSVLAKTVLDAVGKHGKTICLYGGGKAAGRIAKKLAIRGNN